ncbi:MAG: hypothetical protein GX267_04520 [Fibrobacter sp.]|jgi:hypothetical protein|nr:hypothetical protein [Fibrobacter sp.]
MARGPILIFFLLLVCTFFIETQSTELKTTLSRSQITVGERINFTVNANIPKNAKFTPPAPEDNFGKLTVKGWDLKRTELQNYDSISVQYLITTYIPESCTIPPLKFIIEYESTADTLYTENVPLQILSVINTQDSIIDIKDLRSQQIAGKAPLWWLWLLISVVVIFALIFIIIFIKKRLSKPEKLPPPKPAYEEAIEALGILHGKRYLQQGLIREYVFELSEIFKRYIGRRFGVNAEEYTAEELIAWLGVSGLEMKIRHPVEWFFRTTDLVKFAKFTPDDATVERFGKEVMNFLEVTKPQLSEINDSLQSEQTSENQNKLNPSNTGEHS